MNKVTYYTILFFSTLLSWPCSGQVRPFNFNRLTIEHGLADNWVHEAFMDSRGYMWFATQDGLSRFDGQYFHNYRFLYQDSSIQNGNIVTDIVEDDLGHLWLAILGGGLCRFDMEEERFFNYLHDPNDPKSIPSNTALRLHYDASQDHIWIGTYNDGLIRFDLEDKSFRTYDLNPNSSNDQESFVNNSVLDIVQDIGDTSLLWLATASGVHRFNKSSFSGRAIPIDPKVKGEWGIGRMLMVKPNELWYCSEKKGLSLLQTQSEKWAFFPIPRDHTDQVQPSDIFVDIKPKSEDEFWIGSRLRGLAVFNRNKKSFEFVQHDKLDNKTLLSNEVYRLYLDPYQRLWVINFTKGISIMDPADQMLKFVNLPPELCFTDEHNYINGVAWDEPNQTLYVNSFGCNGIYAFDRDLKKKEVIVIRELEGEPHYFNQIFMDSSDKLWVLADESYCESSIYHLPRGESYLQAFHGVTKAGISISKHKITAIAEDQQGNIWLGSFQQGLFKWNPNETFLQHFFNSPSHPKYIDKKAQISDLNIDQKANVWISTLNQGLYLFDRSKDVFIHFGPDLIDTRLNTLAEAPDGKIWVGSNAGGIQILEGTSKKVLPQRLGIADGLPNEKIVEIVRGPAGNMWISTLKGLSKYDWKRQEFINFGKQEGLQDLFLMNKTLGLLSDGRMAVGQQDGFLIFDPDHSLAKRSSIPVVFRSIKIYEEELVFEKNLNYLESVQLHYQQNFFTIEFSALNFSQSQKSRYAYKLEGLDKDWIYPANGRDFASYTNVRPGNYTFKVKAAGLDGDWNTEMARLLIEISPPWWKTWWFYGLIYLGVIVLLYLLYYFRVRQIKREQALKTAFNKKLAEIEMSALRAQMNPHFLFNSLNSIKWYMVQNDAKMASQYLSKFSKLIRLILHNSKNSLVPLQSELEALQLYIQLETLRFQDKFDFELEVDERLDLDQLKIPPMLLQPFVENAIWHGLMHKENGRGQLRLNIVKTKQGIQVTIEDNGIGRKKAQIIKSKSAMKSKSFGTLITDDRIEVFNQLYQTNANSSIIDLMDARGTPLGTRVIINFPEMLHN